MADARAIPSPALRQIYRSLTLEGDPRPSPEKGPEDGPAKGADVASKDDNKPPIIIKKVKKGGHGGHHGGAWKVAYADFVTAMMAFFLLLWLINATTPEQRR